LFCNFEKLVRILLNYKYSEWTFAIFFQKAEFSLRDIPKVMHRKGNGKRFLHWCQKKFLSSFVSQFIHFLLKSSHLDKHRCPVHIRSLAQLNSSEHNRDSSIKKHLSCHSPWCINHNRHKPIFVNSLISSKTKNSV